MAGIKISNFLGIAPKISPELLGAQFAQVAVNAKLYSGDLIPYRNPKDVGDTFRAGTAQTIYPMRDPNDPTINKWLSWLTDVDIAVPTTLEENEQRIYYTGDGAPKVTDYAMAISGGGPYPASSYDLGLPLPSVKPTTSFTAFSEKTTSTIERDGNNTAKIVTTAAHGLITGTNISVAKLTYRTGTYSRTGSTVTVTLNGHGYDTGTQLYMTFEPWTTAAVTNQNGLVQTGTYVITNTGTNTFTFEDPANNGATTGTPDVYVGLYDFNTNEAEVTVVDSTTFTYPSIGPKTPTISVSTGKINLAGNPQSRKYVYTWLTPWGEESIPSEPSDAIYIREGQVVTVGTLPTAKPSGNNNVRGFRLYRTVTGSTGTAYLRLKTVYFSNTLVSASRTTNVATVKTTHPHMLVVGDKIKITSVAFGGSPDTSFNATDALVASVVDKYTFTYASTGTNKATTATSAGTLFWDIAEPDSSTSRYYESTTFVDDYDVSGLSIGLDTVNADAPDANMKGLAMAHNNILIGFVENELCFSEPGRPWSWPIAYRLVFEYPIVAVAPVAGSILVMTTEYPYIVDGTVPENMGSRRIDIPLPCTSKRGVTNMGTSVMYPTWGGIAMYGPDTGAVLVTKALYDFDSWKEAYDPTTMIAEFYNGKYFCSHSDGSFIFERDDQVGGVFVTTPIRFSASYYDGRYDKFYFTTDDVDIIYEWDASDQPLLSLEWKSKVFVDKGYMNIGAARVVADYSSSSEEADAITAFNLEVVAFNTTLWTYVPQLGVLNGPLSYTDPDTLTTVDPLGTLNTVMFNGDQFMQYRLEPVGSYFVNFKLWANKIQIADVVISDSDIFRLPTGYKSDTFEVSVSGSARIRSIHFGETPAGLVNV